MRFIVASVVAVLLSASVYAVEPTTTTPNAPAAATNTAAVATAVTANTTAATANGVS